MPRRAPIDTELLHSLDLAPRPSTLEPDQPFGPELDFWRGRATVIGTDEAGRGPLAGPVVAAAVAFSPEVRLEGIGDSKQLSASHRERMFDRIRECALAFAVVAREPERIDRINILEATREAMDEAVRAVAEKLGVDWPVVLVDGRIPRLSLGRHINITGGDAVSFSIGAASILAKVHRDRLMDRMHEKYPEYGFDRHKGYGTPQHLAAIRAQGPCPIHRRTFTILDGNGERLPIGAIRPVTARAVS